MFHDIDVGKTCDSLVTVQQDAVHKAVEILAVMDSLIQIRDSQIKNYQENDRVWKILYDNQKEATKIQEKEKRKWKLGTIAGGVLIALMVIL